MTEFTVTDDFPKIEAEFDKRFSKAYDFLIAKQVLIKIINTLFKKYNN